MVGSQSNSTLKLSSGQTGVFDAGNLFGFIGKDVVNIFDDESVFAGQEAANEGVEISQPVTADFGAGW